MPDLRECSDGAALAGAVAQHVARRLKEELARTGRAVLVVPGGRSPVPLLQALSTEVLAWERVAVTLTDERWVAPGHPDSNESMVRRHLLQGPAAAARLVPLWTGDATPEAALPSVCKTLEALPRPFAQVVLGMGEDGHVASLFPGSPERSAEVALAARPPRAAQARLSLSLRTLLEARDLVLMISGPGKRRTLERALEEGSAEDLPVRAILRQTAAPVSVFWAP
ncbi:MAG: 6-phosphogluconolactonase [Acidobacteria bacterium]|nr:6-phosphogluconolactonase [Acidobacteriota bacterium]MBI3489769.1 6-phosphogluconolactonase [Acidobacteriota bacterium]